MSVERYFGVPVGGMFHVGMYLNISQTFSCFCGSCGGNVPRGHVFEHLSNIFMFL